MTIARLCLILVAALLLQPVADAAATPQVGVIEGALSYPSDFIPPDMVICAENLATKQIYSTHRHLKSGKYQYKVGYRLEVPPGDYQVYAQLPDPTKYGAGFPKDYRAYYSEFVKCGQTVDCKSHAPIVVTVRSGETVGGIDPQDWYR
jgi:hypothetical protein